MKQGAMGSLTIAEYARKRLVLTFASLLRCQATLVFGAARDSPRLLELGVVDRDDAEWRRS